MTRSFRPRRPRPAPQKSQQELDELVRGMRREAEAPSNYRAHSLKLHGWICAKCGREFEQSNLHTATTTTTRPTAATGRTCASIVTTTSTAARCSGII